MGEETETIKGSNVIIDANKFNIRQVKFLTIYTANTVDAADTFTVDLATYGGTTLLAVYGCKHTTDNSVIVTENVTSSVSTTTVTLTVPAGTDNDQRVAKLVFV